MALIGQMKVAGTAADQEGRYARRRELKLSVQASAGPRAAEVVIHNLSSTGLLLQSSTPLAEGEVIDVHIPQVGQAQATVMWHSENFYGCQFATPLSQAAVSAAVLVAPPERDAQLEPPAQIIQPIVALAKSDLSLRKRVTAIIGLATLCWVPLLGIALLLS